MSEINPIVLENMLDGESQAVWFPDKPSATIRGFTDEISYNKGETVTFFVQTPDVDGIDYDLAIYRLGYYGGNGAREVARFSGRSLQQPTCERRPVQSLEDHANEVCFTYLLDCGNWHPSWAWLIPANTVSGLFMGKLNRGDTCAHSAFFFIIRDDMRHSDILLQTSDTTWNAYSAGPAYQGDPIPRDRWMDGRSLYDVDNTRAFKVSYRRPHVFETTDVVGDRGHFSSDYTTALVFGFGNEYSLIRFLEQNGFDVCYSSGRDSDARGHLILNHRLFITSGHDEYWSGRQMSNVFKARDAGVNLAFFSGNTAYWKIRWEDNYHTMACFKELPLEKLDPEPGVTTGRFRDSYFGPPSYDGHRPENKLTGLLTTRGAITESNLSVTESDGKLRFWRNTSVEKLQPDETLTFNGSLIGFEMDGDLDNGARPAGLFHVSTTEVVDQTAADMVERGISTAFHHMSLYRHALNGALVFHSGTMRLQRALAGFYDGKQHPGDPRLQQAIVNLFADMNVQPTSIQAGLSIASRSTDSIGPQVTVNSPKDGTIVKVLDLVEIAGIADDADGQVAAVETSVDGGRTWHPARGRKYWKFAFTPSDVGDISIRVRAVDDSGNMGPTTDEIKLHAVNARTEDFVRNGDFSCGFIRFRREPTDPFGGLHPPPLEPSSEVDFIAVAWQALQSSRCAMRLSNPAMIQGLNIQRVTAFGKGDGIFQDLRLVPGHWYLFRARVLTEGGVVALRVGGGDCDSTDHKNALTSLIGRWEWLSVSYRPASAACTLQICSHEGPATFKIGEVRLQNT